MKSIGGRSEQGKRERGVIRLKKRSESVFVLKKEKEGRSKVNYSSERRVRTVALLCDILHAGAFTCWSLFSLH